MSHIQSNCEYRARLKKTFDFMLAGPYYHESWASEEAPLSSLLHITLVNVDFRPVIKGIDEWFRPGFLH